MRESTEKCAKVKLAEYPDLYRKALLCRPLWKEKQISGIKLAHALLMLIGLIVMSACQPAAAPVTATQASPDAAAELLVATAEVVAETPGQPIRILFIGDSFIFGINTFVEGLAALADPPVIMEGVEISQPGTSLFGHWFVPQTVLTIQEGGWTVVVLQEDLAVPGTDVDKFYEYARNFHDEIKSIGAETVLLMPNAYDNGNPMTIEEIADAYTSIGAELGIKVAPVGLAWERSMAEYPDFDLYADCDTSYPPGHFVVALEGQNGGLYAQRSQRRTEGQVQDHCT